MGKNSKNKMYKVAIALLLIAAVSAETYDSNQNMYENPWVKDQDGNWHAACHRQQHKFGVMQQAVLGRNAQSNLALCIGYADKIIDSTQCIKSVNVDKNIRATAVNYNNIAPFKDTLWCVEQCDNAENACPGNSKCVEALYPVSGQGVYKVCAWERPTA